MPTSPAGKFSLVLSYLRVSLSNSAAFQTFCGAANAAAALARIYYDALPAPADSAEHTSDELSGYRPCAILGEMTADSSAVDEPPVTAMATGSAVIVIEKDIASGDSDDTAEVVMQIRNALGGILDDLYAQSGTAGRLTVVGGRFDSSAVGRLVDDSTSRLGDAMVGSMTILWSD